MVIIGGKRGRTNISTIRATTPATTGANLPGDTIERILTFLPIKLAIKVGSTSNRLKRSWRLSRNFDFGESFLKQKQKYQICNIINGILKNHEGNEVDRLRLNVPRFFIPMVVVHSWIEFAIKKGIKELDLEFPRLNVSSFNLKLLVGARLESLRLSSCRLDVVPIKLDHFLSLKKLILIRVCLLYTLLSDFLANCLSLETMEVIHCRKDGMLKMSRPHPRLQRLCIIGCNCLIIREISAPKLSVFKYKGYYSNFKFPFDRSIHMLLLEDVSINFTNEVPWSTPRSLVLLYSLAHVRVLSVDGNVFERLAPKVRGDVLQWIPFSYIRLEVFNLNMVDSTYVNPLDIARFLAHCPELLTFTINLEEYWFESYSLFWEVHGKEKFEQFNPHFNKLKEIKVRGFKLHDMEMVLVKFLIGKAPNLETMTLMPPKECIPKIEAADILRYEGMHCLSPASPKVQVTIREQSKDDVME